MSECPAYLPTDEVLRPLPQPAGHSPLSAVAREGSIAADGWRPPDDAAWEAFLIERRRMSASLNRYGILDRFDPYDDHSRGADLYEALVGQDTTALTDSGWLDRIEAITRLEARLAALKAEAITAFDDALHGVSADLGHARPEPGDRSATAGERRWHSGQLRSVSDEIGLVLNLHRGAATTRIHNSWELVRNYPATYAALADGTLTERAAFTIVTELAGLERVEHIQAAEEAVLDWARRHPLQRIKQIARREAARLDARANDRSHQRALDDRSVRMSVADDGTADLITTQDAVDAAGVMTSLTRAALYRRRKGDPRTLDQLRADIALARLLPRTKRAATTADTGHDTAADADLTGDPGSGADLGAAADLGSNANADAGADADAEVDADAGADADADVDGGPGADTRVVIHATAAELEDLINQSSGTGGQLEGRGPIPQSTLRKALARALTHAVYRSSRTRPIEVQVTDWPPPSDPDRYTPSPALDRFVRQRDLRCRFPGCSRPAEYTDVDHRRPFAEGGRTTAANLHCLCRHHHRLKHEGEWKVQRDDDGSHTWTSPTGRRYRDEAPGP
ncbi:MAG TPA: DUF222 domain-containing protein [Kribbella sp.]|nr:DUF222 domain-containing protein [Kribbella sp.]